MLLTITFPFIDLRRLMVSEFELLLGGYWERSRTKFGHMRGVGQFRTRNLGGFEGWVNENILVFGNNSLTVHLPRAMPDLGIQKVRLIRKSCYFDGHLNGRFEILISLLPTADRKSIDNAEIVRRFAGCRALSRDRRFKGRLHRAQSPLRRLWSEATVARLAPTHYTAVTVGQPIVILEDEHACVTDDGDFPARITRDTLSIDGRPVECFAILGHILCGQGSGTLFRSHARTVRTYLLRMLQDVEAMSVVLASLDIKDDEIQRVLATYFRHVNRSRQRLEERDQSALIDYCYEAFNRLVPGGVETLRIKVEASTIRPQLKRNILGSMERTTMIEGDMVMGDKVGGDKFGDINVTGSTNVAVGKGHRMQAMTINENANLAESLNALAEIVRSSGNKNAAVEAELVEKAAKAADEGDKVTAKKWFEKCGDWVVDIAKTVGNAALTAFIKAQMGGS